MHKFHLGQPVCMRRVFPAYGVITELPSEHHPWYRVRASMESFSNFVEFGAREDELDGGEPWEHIPQPGGW